jgi:RNA polymerase sigma-70 factor (ECF subfamily)
MDQRTDAELAAACLAGEREAFAVLVERHQHAVFNLAYRMTGNAAEADDVAQESFIRAYRKLAQFRTDGSFRNWTMGICANLARNRFRQRTRREAAEQRHAEFVEFDGPPAPGTDHHEALDRALMSLPETIRIPVVLKYIEGLSIEDIARTLKIGMSAAKMRLVRGREELLARLRNGADAQAPS